MVMALERKLSVARSFHIRKMFEVPSRYSQPPAIDTSPQASDSAASEDSPASNGRANGGDSHHAVYQIGSALLPDKGPVSRLDCVGGKPGNRPEKQPSDMELMKERFGKLLLGEDMSGGGKGVCSALALSNAITNLSASIFGEQTKLKPMSSERKARWKKEIDWLLSVADHIVEFVPAQQTTKEGVCTEVMITRQRADLLVNIPALRKLDAMLIDTLENFRGQKEFWYVSRDSEEAKNGKRKDNKWWLPTVKVPPNGLSEVTRRWLHYQKDSVAQVQKAAMAINAQVLSEMEMPESYIEALPKNGRATLGDSIYKSITEECFDPEQFLSTLDLSTEHKVLDLKNRIEASVVIWKRKLHLKDGSKSSWGSAVSLEKRELFEERAETILLLLKQWFPGLPQSSLDITKIQYNRDVGHAILESYSRILESLAFTVMSRIEDVLYADSLAGKSSAEVSEGKAETDAESVECPISGEEGFFAGSKTLQDFMGWQSDTEAKKHNESDGSTRSQSDTKPPKSPYNLTPKKFSYLEKLENLNGFRSSKERH